MRDESIFAKVIEFRWLFHSKTLSPGFGNAVEGDSNAVECETGLVKLISESGTLVCLGAIRRLLTVPRRSSKNQMEDLKHIDEEGMDGMCSKFEF